MRVLALLVLYLFYWPPFFFGPSLYRKYYRTSRYNIRTTFRLLRMRQMFHGVDAPPTTCMRSPKRKRLRNRCFATATDINGCSVARSIEVTMVDRSRLPRSAIMAAQVQSTDVFPCYQRLRVSCALCNNFQAARPRSGGSPLFMINHRSSDNFKFILDVRRDGKRTETRIGMEGICITHSCIPLYTNTIISHSGGMQEWAN